MPSVVKVTTEATENTEITEVIKRNNQ